MSYSANSVHLKFAHGGITRKFKFDRQLPPRWSTLCQVLIPRFDLPDTAIWLRYTDLDGDQITVSSSAEIAELWNDITTKDNGNHSKGRCFKIDVLLSLNPSVATLPTSPNLTEEFERLNAKLAKKIERWDANLSKDRESLNLRFAQALESSDAALAQKFEKLKREANLVETSQRLDAVERMQFARLNIDLAAKLEKLDATLAENSELAAVERMKFDRFNDNLAKKLESLDADLANKSEGLDVIKRMVSLKKAKRDDPSRAPEPLSLMDLTGLEDPRAPSVLPHIDSRPVDGLSPPALFPDPPDQLAEDPHSDSVQAPLPLGPTPELHNVPAAIYAAVGAIAPELQRTLGGYAQVIAEATGRLNDTCRMVSDRLQPCLAHPSSPSHASGDNISPVTVNYTPAKPASPSPDAGPTSFLSEAPLLNATSASALPTSPPVLAGQSRSDCDPAQAQFSRGRNEANIMGSESMSLPSRRSSASSDSWCSDGLGAAARAHPAKSIAENGGREVYEQKF